MELINPNRIIELKDRVKAECLRRNKVGSVEIYGANAYDFTQTPTTDEKILSEHYQKIAIPMNAINLHNTPETEGLGRIVSDDDLTIIDTYLTSYENRDIYINNIPSDCATSCTGTCTTACTGSCISGCSKTCTGSCSGQCKGSCKGGCKGGCGGCDSGCTSCTGSCKNIGCSGSCTTSCYTSACTGCGGQCNVCTGVCTSSSSSAEKSTSDSNKSTYGSDYYVNKVESGNY